MLDMNSGQTNVTTSYIRKLAASIREVIVPPKEENAGWGREIIYQATKMAELRLASVS